jgi:sugar lactone lactonase YvrE
MTSEGETRVLADSIDGEAIGKVNFVLRDSKDRIWITVSTRIRNWMHALRTDLRDGYLARYERGKFRIVADGFGFTNEIPFDAREEWLYVVETTGGCIVRLRIDEDGTLRDREVFGPARLGKGAWPDGIAFDTPQGDFRVLQQSCDRRRLVPRSRRCALDGERARTCAPFKWVIEGQANSLFPAAHRGAADGSLE